MPASEDDLIFPEGASTELLMQARQKAVQLLNKLLAEQSDVNWQPARPNDDPRAAADWRQALICAIESAKRAIAAIDAAIKIAPGTVPPDDSTDQKHRWN